MSINFKYSPPETDSGRLRTPITFHELVPNAGPEPGQHIKKNLYSCFAEIYNPSMKDLTIMETVACEEAVTIRIRDPGADYIPTTSHFFTVDDYRYTGKIFNIVNVAPDLQNNQFVKMIGAYTE